MQSRNSAAYMLILVITVTLSSSHLPIQAADKLAVPSDDARKKAKEEIAGVYGAADSDKMIQDGIATKNSAIKFVLLRKSHDLAVEKGDAQTAMRVIDEIDKAFVVDALLLKARALHSLANQRQTPQFYGELATHFDSAINKAVADDRFEVAKPLAEIAVDSAVKSRSPELRKHSVELDREVNDLAAAFNGVDWAKLKDDPAHAETNLAAGKYLCFLKGEWDKGLSHLALGGDPDIQGLVKQELAKTATPLELGDGWWGVTEGYRGRAANNIKIHAGEFYRAAEASVQGFEKTKVQNRLREISDQLLSNASWEELLSQVDIDKTRLEGKWIKEGNVITFKPQDRGYSLLALPKAIHGDYDVSCDVARLEGNTYFYFVLPIGDTHCKLMCFVNDDFSGLQPINGEGIESNGTAVKGRLVNRKQVRIDISVRYIGDSVSIESTLQGEDFVSWKGPITAIMDGRKTPAKNHLLVGGDRTVGTAFLACRLRASTSD